MMLSIRNFMLVLVLAAVAAQVVSSEPIRVAVVQSVIEDTIEANRTKLIQFIREARDAECRLVVFPENSLYWPERSRETPSQITLDAAIDSLRAAAKMHRVSVAFGTAYQTSEKKKFRYRALIFGPAQSADFDAYSVAVTLPLGESGSQARRGFAGSCGYLFAFTFASLNPTRSITRDLPGGEVGIVCVKQRIQAHESNAISVKVCQAGGGPSGVVKVVQNHPVCDEDAPERG